MGKCLEKSRKLHRQNLKNMRSSLDTGCPRRFKHVTVKAKKQQIMEGT